MTSNWHVPVRPQWLALYDEEILEPDLAIVDPHHHLWDRPGDRYLLPELAGDVGTGHNIVSTVFVQCRSMYRTTGNSLFRPLGETEFVTDIAIESERGAYGPTRVAAGIVGHVDLRSGDDAYEVLKAHCAAGKGRFRGIRHISAWDEDPELMNPANVPPKNLLSDPTFRQGFAQLAPLGLSFDAWLYHTQIDELRDLAEAFPDTRIVVNHVGGPLGYGSYATRKKEVFEQWRAAVKRLSVCSNVYMKLGGFGMRTMGFALFDRIAPIPSVELAKLWQPYFEVCVDAFGPERCMFESNFPVDKISCSYSVLWNAFKRLAGGVSSEDRNQLFHRTAADFYRLSI